MPGLRRRLYLALISLGAFAQVAQALLIREALVVFYGNEISLGAFFGAWLFWVAVGSIGVIVLRNRPWVRHPLPLLRTLILSLPFLLAGQIVAARTVRMFLDVSAAEFMALGDLFLATLLITVPASVTTGVIFPLACRALAPPSAPVTRGTVRDVSHLYIFDALGALAGGALFTFVLIEWLGVWQSIGAVTVLLAATALSLGGTVRLRLTALGVGVIGLALAVPPFGNQVHRAMEAVRFATLQPGLELLDAVETRYGHVAVARLGEQVSVVANGRIAQSFPSRYLAEQQAAYFYAQSTDARQVLVFGGLAGDLAPELLRYPLTALQVVEDDQRAFEHIRPHLTPSILEALQDPRLAVHFGDGRRFANRLSGDEGYDLVLVLNAAPSSAHSNRYFTREFYERMQRAMAPDGVLCTRVSSASNYLGRAVKSYSGSVFRTLSTVFEHVTVAPGDEHVFCASGAAGQVSVDARELERRYLDTPLDEHRFPAVSFHSVLPPDRVAFVRQQLEEEGGELNTDAKPVTYYLNMLLWGRFTGSAFVDWLQGLRRLGPWPYLVPLAVVTLLMLLRSALQGLETERLRRQSATLALTVLGMVAMAVQLALLFSYQAQVGFVFGRIALLNGVFMSGLAVGAGAFGQRLARAGRPTLALGALMGIVATGMALLPHLLPLIGRLDTPQQEAVYLGLCTLAGLLTGTGFPLGIHLAQMDTGNVVRTSGIMGAADNLGGALGGLLTGALLVPILGVAGTSYLLATAASIAVLPMVYAQLAPRSAAPLKARGQAAFPYPMISWALAALVISLFVLSLLARDGAPGPVIHFDDETLAGVSGSARFELRTELVPHYLGTDAADPGSEDPAKPMPDTVSLATMTVAADIRGHAGPINLLVSLDGQGMLRGVAYVHSHETPSYIADIGTWLTGLVGQNLSRQALDLDRVDGLAGATVTSRAALVSINRAAAAGGQAAFGKRFATPPEGMQTTERSPWLSSQFLLTLVLVLAFFPVYRSGRDRVRLVYQAAVLVTFGFGLNTLVTELDLINLIQGRLPSLSSAPQWYLLIGFVLVTAVLFGQVYCGYVCPFGALQEFISRLGRRLYLRSYVEHPLETRLRYGKFVLLALMLSAVWLTGDVLWASFNPMQHVFAGHLSGWMGAILGVSLVGALFYYRFWCRYFCPFGAFLALSNKLAFAKQLGPARRFDHCDLGAREDYDVDCIQCHRCISGRDFGVRERKAKGYQD